MQLNTPRPDLAEAAKRAAKNLLASTLPLMNAPPINLGIICEWLGVEVYARPCDSFGAMYVCSRQDGKKFLTANTKLQQGRFRFSIAHELGHILLDHQPLRHVFEWCPDIERQADVFAAELLMPEQLILADYPNYTVDDLAKRYRVSRQSLQIRLQGHSR